MKDTQSGNSFIRKLATFIVDKKSLFFLLYGIALIFSLFSMGWVQVENDVTTYLPADTETRQGIEVMNDHFTTFATAKVMVSNVSYQTALTIRDTLLDIEGVQMVSFDDTENHYRGASALYDVNFSAETSDPLAEQAMGDIKEALQNYDVSYDTYIGVNEIDELAKEMLVILIVAVVIIVIVLTLTSRSYLEVPVLLLTFGSAALLNKGTDFLCGKISFISNSIAVVLQLALAIDYAIILCHRFSDEHEDKPAREACIAALSKAIPEISASSLTTISGLIALSFMKFSIGLDMSVVLIKSVLLSLMSVFTLMPGLLVLFTPLIDKTKHRKLLPNITPIGKFAVAARGIMPIVFAVILVGAFFLSSHSPYCYSYTNVETTKMSEQQRSQKKIRDTFGTENMVALVVPSGNYEAEKAILKELEHMPQVKSTMGLSGMEVLNGYHLTDSVTPRQFAEMIDLDYELATGLYTAYAVQQDQYGEILSGLSEYDVPLFDIFMFLKDEIRDNNILLEGDRKDQVEELFELMDTAQLQLQSKDYTRMVVYLNLPEESQETFDFLQELRDIMGKYYVGDYYVVGNSTSARDLAASFSKDNLIISVLSAFFVILVLLFTFMSVGLPVLLIVVIQGSIWINFSFPTLTQTPLYFLGYLIVNAIQMGANIDYAIVISSHYQELKKQMPHKKAIIQALNNSFPTVFTSGTILSAAGLLIGNLSANPVISIMGNCLGRGTIISMILVLCVLPSILVLGDSIIEKTKFKLKTPELKKVQTSSGTMKLNGHVKGYICGMVDGEFTGSLKGDLNASVITAGDEPPMALEEGEESHE